MKTQQTHEKTVCPNCEQWQDNVKENASIGLYADCFNDCAERGLSPKVQTCLIAAAPAQAHSPLPWKVGKHSRIEDARRFIIADPTHDPREDEGSKLNANNAAFIVRACNEYEQSCRDREQFKTMYQDELTWYNDMKAHVQRLADALAIAERAFTHSPDGVIRFSDSERAQIRECVRIHSSQVSDRIQSNECSEPREALAQWEEDKQ